MHDKRCNMMHTLPGEADDSALHGATLMLGTLTVLNCICTDIRRAQMMLIMTPCPTPIIHNRWRTESCTMRGVTEHTNSHAVEVYSRCQPALHGAT